MDKTAVRIIDVFDTVDEFVFSILMMTLPFGWQFSIIPLLLFGVLMFRKALKERITPSKEKVIYFLPVFAYFLIMLISLVYSKHPGRGLDLLVQKSSFLAIPLLLLFTAFSRRVARKGFRFFVLGTLLVSLLYIVTGLYRSTQIGDGMLCIVPGFSSDKTYLLDTVIHNNYLMGDNFSFLMHPTYTAVLLAFSISIVVFTLINEHKSLLIQRIAIPVFIVESFVLILLSTNGALMSAVVLSVILIFLTIRYRHYLDLKKYWLILVAMILLSGVAYNPQFQVLSGRTSGSDENTMRLKAREITLDVIKEHPFLGVGNGDLYHMLAQKYEDSGLDEMKELRINPHNQYLHTWAETGIPGLLTLLWILGTLIWFGFKRRNFLMITFALLFGISMNFESMMNRYWGIMMMAIFYSLFYFHSEPDPEEEDR
ncbi:O-antigen ligase family protein [Saccharicrinis sp. FJH54]|uniref:O-antigen ligase family protein n=1 Tax=Saccharicrinis sp. FJH54 TaxID=3344665 RepID=UPI0035D486D4